MNPNNINWRYYGGANPPVVVCERWQGEHGFENFLSDLGERPTNTTLGRFGDVGHYEPGNVAWQTWNEQRTEQKKKYSPEERSARAQQAAVLGWKTKRDLVAAGIGI
jgi:hypothetical protein